MTVVGAFALVGWVAALLLPRAPQHAATVEGPTA
jgi:hypothetical protein